MVKVWNPVDDDYDDLTGGGGSDAVDSVNGETGAVTLTAGDIGSTATGDVAATDVQSAIAELASEKQTAAQVATAVAGEATARDAAIETHRADTTNVHGFANAATVETKVGHLTVTQAVDLDAIETTVAGIDSRATFSNADHAIQATDRYVAQVGSLSAARTATLPAANAVPAGHRVTVVDESASITDTFLVTIAAAGADTILNPYDRYHTTSAIIRQPGSSISLVSDGVSQWAAVDVGHNVPAAWWYSPISLAIPNNKWTPVPWTSLSTDPYRVAGVAAPTAATTIAAGSNAAALPQATIHVASTTGFTSTGWAIINGPPGASVYTIFSYTGVTATTFTGCNTSHKGGQTAIATGTMATGQAVQQHVVEYLPATPGYYCSIVDVAWAANGTGVRGVRFRGTSSPFYFVGSAAHHPALNIATQHTQCQMQPAAASAADGTVVEVFQTSGGVLNLVNDSIAAPSLMQVYTTGMAR